MKQLIIGLVVLTAAVIITWLIPVTERKTIIITAPVIVVSQQLNNPANWKKWNSDLKISVDNNSANYTVAQDYQLHTFIITTVQQHIEVKNPIAGRFQINIEKEGHASFYNISLAAGKDIKSTVVLTEKQQSLFSRIFSSSKNNLAADNFITHLKTFMETDSLYYGFNISLQPVVDSNIVSCKKQVPTSEKFTVLPFMYKILQDFVSANNLNVMQGPMLMFSPMKTDSISVVTMLAINKLPIKNNRVQTMKMPLNGRMLVGIFQGKYKNRIHLETAMQQYCLDKNIQIIINSYEKFTNAKIPENDEAFVEMEIHFPVL